MNNDKKKSSIKNGRKHNSKILFPIPSFKKTPQRRMLTRFVGLSSCCGLSSVRNLRCGLERHRIHLFPRKCGDSLSLSLSLSSGLSCLSAAELVLQTATYLCKNSQGIHGGKSTHAFPELFYMLVLQDRCISSNVETGDSKSREIIFHLGSMDCQNNVKSYCCYFLQACKSPTKLTFPTEL